MRVGRKSVTAAEFNRNYAAAGSMSRGEYTTVLADYLRKVMAAEDAGIDTVASIRSEIHDYASQRAIPLMRDRETDDSLARVAYNRLRSIASVNHILIDYGQPAARQLADSIRNAIENGADFGEMATRFSADPSAIINRGHIGHILPGTTPYSFEDAAFTTPSGTLSHVVATEFGFHIILTDSIISNRSEVAPYDSVRPLLISAMASDWRGQLSRSRFLMKFRQSADTSAEMSFDRALRHLHDTDKAFRNDIDDFRNNLLVYEITQRLVTEPSLTDTSARNDCFIRHRDSLTWQHPHLKGHVVAAINDSTADAARKWILKNGINPDTITTSLSRRFGRGVKVQKILAPTISASLVKSLAEKGSAHDPDGLWHSYLLLDGQVIDRPQDTADVSKKITDILRYEISTRWTAKLRERYTATVTQPSAIGL